MSVDAFTLRPKETAAALKLSLVASAAPTEFQNRVHKASQEKAATFDVATRPGWHDGLFVFPNQEIVGPPGILSRSGSSAAGGVRNTLACFPTDEAVYGAKYSRNGNLNGWHELCGLAQGNSRLTMAIALAFVGPLGELLGGDPPMIQLIGAAESGKSSIAIAAASVWGGHDSGKRKSFSETWNNTTNFLEPVAAAHDSTFLVLDETELLDAKDSKLYPVIKKTVMRLYNGVRKGRSGQIGRLTWWMGLLSTSNKSLEEMAEDARTTCPDSLRTRLIDVPMPLPRRAFEELHGLSVRSFSVKLLKIVRNHHGGPSVLFVRRVAAWRERNPEELDDFLSKRRYWYRGRAKQVIHAGTRRSARVTDSFGKIYAAGCAAIKLKILPWSGDELGDALIACEQAHIDQLAGALTGLGGEMRPEDAWNRLVAHVRTHRREFVDLRTRLMDDEAAHDHEKCLGYVNKQKNGPLEYLFSEAILCRICGSRGGWDRLAVRLKGEGALLSDQRGKVVKRQIFEKSDDPRRGRRYVVAIQAVAFRAKSTSSDAPQSTASTSARDAAPAVAKPTTALPPLPAAPRRRPVLRKVSPNRLRVAETSDASDLAKILALHKKLVRARTVTLSRGGGQLCVTSFVQSRRIALQSTFASPGPNLKATVRAATLGGSARSPSARMEVKDGQLVITGKGLRAAIPLLIEEQITFPRVETNSVPVTDAAWLRENLPHVKVFDLRKVGVLSAECDGKDWCLTCRDHVHGAFVFGQGSCRLKFSLVPSDAVVLHSLLSAAGDSEVSIVPADDLLIVRAGIHLATIHLMHGEVITRQEVTSNTRQVARFKIAYLRQTLKGLKRAALAEHADPVLMTLKANGIRLSASGPAGSVQDEFEAECKEEISVRLSYRSLSALAARARGRVVLGVRGKEGEIDRVTLKCGELFLVMATADYDSVTAGGSA
jgi:hypothetical protein